MFPTKNGSEENMEPSSSTKLCMESRKQTQVVEKSTEIPQEPVEQAQIILESLQTLTNNIQKSKEILPLNTEPLADSTVVAVPKLERNDSIGDKTSSLDQPKNTPKKRIKERTIKTEPISNTNDVRKIKRKHRSREVEPIEIDETSPRVLRSRQIKIVKEEPLSPVPDNNSSF